MALVAGFLAGVAGSMNLIDEADAKTAAAEADRDKAVESYQSLMKTINGDSTSGDNIKGDGDKQIDTKVTVTGGAFNGWDANQGGYGIGYFSVRNNTGGPIQHVGITASLLDAGGNIVGEASGSIESAIQPGQTANVKYYIEPKNTQNVTHVQAAEVIYYTGSNYEGQTFVTVSSDIIAVR